MKNSYVHGYDPKENMRLQDQALTLAELLLSDTSYPAGSRVLEAGCGVGAKTALLAAGSPDALFTSIDISGPSVTQAEKVVNKAGLKNVIFRQADIFNLPFETGSFDHIFVCFVLEHLSGPANALRELKKVLKPGGSITVIEGDHGSTHFHPDSEAAHRAIQCLVQLQKKAGETQTSGGHYILCFARQAMVPFACLRAWSMPTPVCPRWSKDSPKRRLQP